MKEYRVVSLGQNPLDADQTLNHYSQQLWVFVGLLKFGDSQHAILERNKQ
jgi:hypothetical protein